MRENIIIVIKILINHVTMEVNINNKGKLMVLLIKEINCIFSLLFSFKI